MGHPIIKKFNSLKPLEKTIVVIVLLTISLIIPAYFYAALIILTITILITNSNAEHSKLLKERERKYRQSLENLRRSPRDADIYMMTLSLGRQHYNLMTTGLLSEEDRPIINDLVPIFKSEYERSLEVLRNSPQNSNLRKETLEMARTYYSTMRGGVTSIYDEQAISNDLSTVYGSDMNDIK